MKRTIALLLLVTILFSACSGNHEFDADDSISGINNQYTPYIPIEVGGSMSEISNQYTPYITINALSVYEISGNYLITIDDGNFIQKLAEFSPDRKCHRIQGFDLIKDGEINQLLNINFSELTEKIGQPHVDIGSGFYIPSYVTEDAHLICFQLENEIVIGVIRRDLLTNKVVDCISN